MDFKNGLSFCLIHSNFTFFFTLIEIVSNFISVADYYDM